MNKFSWLVLAASLNAFAQAPAVDRVGFPEGYQTWQMFYTLDRSDNKQVRTIYGNSIAAGVKDGSQGNYPYGSVMVLETQAALKDADGNPILDGNGRFQKDPAAAPTINTMRKGKDFGAAYGDLRNGEWEYVGYTAAGGYGTLPQNSQTCANCHLQAAQGKDWVFRGAGHFKNGDMNSLGAVPGAIIKNYSFVPGVVTVKAQYCSLNNILMVFCFIEGDRIPLWHEPSPNFRLALASPTTSALA